MSKNRGHRNGKPINGRPINGILLLNKPVGPTSNAALQTVKRLYNASKAGHTGSLDPLATGMLPICFGEATKFSQFLLTADKQYCVTAKLGVRTDSGDAMGTVLAEKSIDSQMSAAGIEQILQKYRGEIEQIPPMYSALKHQGTPLYKLARQGIEVAREARKVNIFSLELDRFQGCELQLSVHCSKGTYVRSLIDDIGQDLGCGAHVSGLNRLSVGPYQQQDMVSMDQLQRLSDDRDFQAMDDLLLDTATSVLHWPQLKLSESSAFYMRNGQTIRLAEAPSDGWVSLVQDGQFLGVGEILDDGRVAPRRLIKSA